jgi:hypothetical protein
MANFVMVIDEVTIEQFEKVNAIQASSKEKIKWIPQQASTYNVSSLAFTLAEVPKRNHTPAPPQPGRQVPPPPMDRVYKNLRLEWDDEGISFADEVLTVFKHHHHGEEQNAG